MAEMMAKSEEGTTLKIFSGILVMVITEVLGKKCRNGHTSCRLITTRAKAEGLGQELHDDHAREADNLGCSLTPRETLSLWPTVGGVMTDSADNWHPVGSNSWSANSDVGGCFRYPTRLLGRHRHPDHLHPFLPVVCFLGSLRSAACGFSFAIHGSSGCRLWV